MMKTVAGVRFKKAGKIYYFDAIGLPLHQYDHVVVETVQGVEYGEVALAPREIDDAEFKNPIKPILRAATKEDEQNYASLREKEEKARGIFEEKVKEHHLDMKLIRVEYTFDNKKAIFYFTADGRVDFRKLVKDLASIFRLRIELRQIGVRDEAKLFGTLGVCGWNTCCSQWLGDFTPVSIKMAKEQGLSLNSTKISGICGRLLCCLTYEDDFYRKITKKMPRIGNWVTTPDGEGQVYRLNVLDEKVVVRVHNGEETEIRSYDVDEVVKSGEKHVLANNKRQQMKKEQKDQQNGEPEQEKHGKDAPQKSGHSHNANRSSRHSGQNHGRKQREGQDEDRGSRNSGGSSKGDDNRLPKDKGWNNRKTSGSHSDNGGKKSGNAHKNKRRRHRSGGHGKNKPAQKTENVKKSK